MYYTLQPHEMNVIENFHPDPAVCHIINTPHAMRYTQEDLDLFCRGKHGGIPIAKWDEMNNTFNLYDQATLCSLNQCSECFNIRCRQYCEEKCSCPRCPTTPTIQPLVKTLKTCGKDNKSRIVCLLKK